MIGVKKRENESEAAERENTNVFRENDEENGRYNFNGQAREGTFMDVKPLVFSKKDVDEFI